MRSRFRRGVVRAAAAAAMLLGPAALAVTTIWDGGLATNNSNWNTAANWAGNAVPPITNDVQFASAFASGTTIRTNGNRTANGLLIHTLTPFTIAGNAGDVLTLTNGVITRDDLVGTESSQVISVGIALGENANWSIWGAGTLRIDGPISGAGRSLSKFGWGTLILTGGGTYSGGTLVDESLMQINGNGPGTGPITVFNAAGLDLEAATIANAINLNGDGEAGSGALRALSSSTVSGPVTLQTSSTINVQSGLLHLSGVISDGAAISNLTKTGVGELRLSAANSFDGTTSINAGILSIANGNALGAGLVSIVAGGSLNLQGVNVSRALTVAGTGAAGQGALGAANGASSWNGPVTFVENSSVVVSSGSELTIAGPIGIAAGKNVINNSAGILNISGPQSHGANASFTTAGTGLVNLNSNAGTAATATVPALANLGLYLPGGARVTLGANQTLRDLAVNAAAHLDLNSAGGAAAFHSVGVYASDLNNAKTALYAAIATANATGAADSTAGIFDSSRALHPNSRVGIALRPDEYGQNHVLIRLTRIGDLNLDGIVTISDFIDLASHFNSTGATWQEGDLNYDGSVTISDFIDLASNFNTSYSGASFPVSPQDQTTLSNFSLTIGATSVPEPAAVALLVLIAGMASLRRRRV